MIVAALLLPNTSPIASIPVEASMPVLMVTIKLMLALHTVGPNELLAGKAILVKLERGAGGVVVQSADKGGVLSGDVV